MLPEIPMRGEVFWVRFSDGMEGEAKDKHPALVMSRSAMNSKMSVVIVLPITTNTTTVYEFQVAIPANVAGMTSDSKIQIEALTCVNRERLIERMGRVDSEMMREVEEKLLRHLGIEIGM